MIGSRPHRTKVYVQPATAASKASPRARARANPVGSGGEPGAPPRFPSALTLYAIAAAIQVAAVLASHLAGSGKPSHPDAIGQDILGSRIAAAWDSGGFPTAGDLRSIAGTQVWGPEFFIGAVYRFFGHHWLYARLAMACVAGIGPPAIAVLARRYTRDQRALWSAFLLAALWPATLYWTVSGTKDAYVGGLALATLACVTVAPAFRGALIGILGASAFLVMRPVVGLALVSVAVVVLFTGGGRVWSSRSARVLGGLVAMTLVGAALALPRAAELTRTINSNTIEFAEGERAALLEDGITSNVIRAAKPSTVAKALTSPLPWKLRPQDASPYRWLFAASTLWILMLPLIGFGIADAFRRNRRMTWGLVIFCAVYFGGYLLTYAGEFARQRSLIEPIGLLFVVIALASDAARSIRVTTVWLALVSCFGLAHVLTLVSAS